MNQLETSNNRVFFVHPGGLFGDEWRASLPGSAPPDDWLAAGFLVQSGAVWTVSQRTRFIL
jgi:hypothetical protein